MGDNKGDAASEPYRRHSDQAHTPSERNQLPQSMRFCNCARCHEPILPGQAWDLGHVDGDGLGYAVPSTGTRVTAPKVATMQGSPSQGS